MELKPHDLVKIRGVGELISTQPLPDWAIDSLDKTPFVVVRRAEFLENFLPIGIRGNSRGERLGAYLSASPPLKVITPYALSDVSNWQALYEHYLPPAIESLLRIKPLLNISGYEWGPTGSAGFELATGCKTLKESSDLDLVIDMPDRIGLQLAKELLQELQHLTTVRLDIQLNTPIGGIAMQEFINSDAVLIKTSKGPVSKKCDHIWN